MATGGEEFGDDTTPILRKTDDQDDGDEGPGGDQTTEFEPGASSTPAPNGTRLTTMNRPGEEPSLNLPDTADELSSTTITAKNGLLEYYPNAEITELKYRMDAKGRIEVGLISPKKPYFRLLTEVKGKPGEYQINKEITKEVLKVLGKGRLETLEEEIKNLTDGINYNKALAEDSRLSKTERNKARERAKMQIEKRADLGRQLDRLKKGKYSIPSESIELETFQKNDEERGGREQEIQTKREENAEIMNDKNRSPEERERAKENDEKLEQEQNEIDNEREREIEKLPLRDRLREKVKAIFKKYGFTVGAVFLAVGTTLGVVLSSLSNSLKTVSKNVGNGLKTLGKKIAPILPGIIGAVVSFVLRTAGNIVGFLGKHAWLLILAVAAFLFERVMKRRG